MAFRALNQKGDLEMKTFCTLVLFCLIGVGSLFAQSVAKVISVPGMLNGRTISFPKPEYPESARQAHIGGMVAVNVVIDESGAVISAVAEVNDQHEVRDAEGRKLDPVPVDPTLREAAESAARLATFAPLSVGGIPVKFEGKLLYNFVADNSNRPPRIGEIFGPLLNPKAISLPQPIYPPVAKGASGTVTVYVVVDTEGNVVSAAATSGHPLLLAAAEEAAMKAKFAPDRVAGQPMKFDGVLTYTFAIAQKKVQ